MQKIKQLLAVLVATFVALLVGAGSASAAPDSDGEGNRDWGVVASNTAQLDTSHSTTDDGDDANGGGMGQHSRSTAGANQQGGFAAQDTDGDGDGGNGFNIEFNTDGGRLGVGNATQSPPHNEDSPSDGGNGRHATNNADLASVLDPVTGDFTTNAGGTAPDFEEELEEGASTDGDDE